VNEIQKRAGQLLTSRTLSKERVEVQSLPLTVTPTALKSQQVRVLDFTIYGPFMIYLGLKKSPLTQTEKNLIIALGVGTIIYNFRNWSSNR